MRWIKAIAAAAAMLLVIAGAPVLLLGWGSLGPGWWRAADGSLLLTILTVAGWLAWAAFTLATVLEVIRYVSGNRFVPDLPLLGGLQTLCAGLVLAVVGVAASSATTVTPAQPQMSTLVERVVPTAAVAPASAAPAPTQTPSAGPQRGPDATSEPKSAEAASAPSQAPIADLAEHPSYTVASGDDLWSVAERLLGDGRRWRELARANPELLSDPTTQLAAGTQLKLPTAPAAPTIAPAAPTSTPQPQTKPKPKKVTVEKGDTLSGLAKAHLGSTGRWPKIAAANADLISDPDHIEIGWELVIPERAASKTPERDEGKDGLAASGSAKGGTTSGVGEPPIADQPDHSGETMPASGSDDRVESTVKPSTQGEPTQPPTPRHPGPDPGSQTEDAPTAAQTQNDDVEDAVQEPDRALIGSLGALAAAGLMGGWQARRLLQSRVRQPGRRVQPLDDGLTRLHTAVGRRRASDPSATLDAALRAIGRHCHRAGVPLPQLDHATLLADGRTRFVWAEPAGPPPPGFDEEEAVWVLPPETVLGAIEHPCAFPALVSLGATDTGETVLVDLENAGVLGLAADDRELQLASLASIAVELASAPWAAELALVSVGTGSSLVRAAGGEAVTCITNPDQAIADLHRHHAQRARELDGLDLRRLRTDPERADAVAPRVYVFHDQLSSAQQSELDDLLTGTSLGIAAVVLTESQADAQLQLFGDPLRPNARFAPLPDTRAASVTTRAKAAATPVTVLPADITSTVVPDFTSTVIPAKAGISPSASIELTAHSIPESTRAAVSSWYQVAETTSTEAAPWWSDEDAPNLRLLPTRHPPSEEPVDIVSLRRLVPPHPTLALIGPIELNGAAGPEPARARYQLIEMASWLLEHPGRTATQMAAGLGIAETTRRSNLSRLRAWLGSDPDDQPYLPEAYSGRIQLHPEVTSDVARLRLLTGPGVNRIGEDGLIAALDLIRGGLLADAAPSQWYWAESLRSDVAATLRDAGLVLVDRALDRGELDLARWAADHALMVAPEDELLMCARIRTEHAAGNRPGVERHVLRLTQQARALGVDLMPQTVLLCQQVMEGRARPRRA